jgi:hypothetical protein
MAAKGQTGVAVDAQGGPVVDPTANVLALVEAANKRQDDLRAASQRYNDSCIKYQHKMAELRAHHAREIRELDTKRLEATRAVDINAGQTEAKRSLDALQTLATQTQATASTIAASIAETVTGITARLAALEKSSYEGAGKDAGPSAQMQQLTAAIAQLAMKDSNREGKGQGMNSLWGYVIGAGGFISAIFAIIAVIYALNVK